MFQSAVTAFVRKDRGTVPRTSGYSVSWSRFDRASLEWNTFIASVSQPACRDQTLGREAVLIGLENNDLRDDFTTYVYCHFVKSLKCQVLYAGSCFPVSNILNFTR